MALCYTDCLIQKHDALRAPAGCLFAVYGRPCRDEFLNDPFNGCQVRPCQGAVSDGVRLPGEDGFFCFGVLLQPFILQLAQICSYQMFICRLLAAFLVFRTARAFSRCSLRAFPESAAAAFSSHPAGRESMQARL